MTGKIIGYIRVSTFDQNPQRQLKGIYLDEMFVDHASAISTQRPQLQAMMRFVRKDDVVKVHSMDRLARNVRNLLEIIDILVSKHVKVEFIKEKLTFSGNDSPMSRLMLSMMGAVAEFEYSFIKERQREGIEIAKKAGKYKGRKKALDEEKIRILKERLTTTRDPKTKIAKDLGITVKTLYNYLKELDANT